MLENARSTSVKAENYLPHFVNDAAVDKDVMSTFRDKDSFWKLQ